MEGEHTLNSLKRLRAQIAGEIEALNDATKQKIIDLAHVDATLRLLDPTIEYENIPPKIVRPAPKAFRGNVQSILFDEIRRLGRATPRELTDAVMKDRGLDPEDQRARAIVGKRVKDRLGTLRRQGKIQNTEDAAGTRAWEACDLLAVSKIDSPGPHIEEF